MVEARKDTTVVLHLLADDRRILPIDRTGELPEAPPLPLVVSWQPRLPEPAEGMKPSTRQRFCQPALRLPPPRAGRGGADRRNRLRA